MTFKFIGCELSQGEFNGNAYNNYLLYMTTPIEMQKGMGEKLAMVSTRNGKAVPKVKSVDFASVFGCSPSADFFNSIKGKEVDVLFNMYGNIEHITLSK